MVDALFPVWNWLLEDEGRAGLSWLNLFSCPQSWDILKLDWSIWDVFYRDFVSEDWNSIFATCTEKIGKFGKNLVCKRRQLERIPTLRPGHIPIITLRHVHLCALEIRHLTRRSEFIAQKVIKNSFCRSQLTHKPVNLFVIITNIRTKLSDLCGNGLLQNDFVNTFGEIRVCVQHDFAAVPDEAPPIFFNSGFMLLKPSAKTVPTLKLG